MLFRSGIGVNEKRMGDDQGKENRGIVSISSKQLFELHSPWPEIAILPIAEEECTRWGAEMPEGRATKHRADNGIEDRSQGTKSETEDPEDCLRYITQSVESGVADR